MKNKLFCIAIAAGALALISTARSESATVSSDRGGKVQVTFEHPENFADVRARVDGETDGGMLDSLRDYIVQTAGPRVSGGNTLAITFTDIDLAGAFVPTKATRQIKSLYPPKAKFTWVLTDAKGTILRQGSENLVDTGFLTQSNLKSDPMFYEKEMLQVWIKRTLR